MKKGILLTVLLATTSIVIAAEDHGHEDHEHEDHGHEDHGHEAAALGAHVHGHITLGLAQMDSSVQVELTAPLNSLVAFEHEPSNEREQQALTQAVAAIAPPSLGSDCQLVHEEGSLVALAGGHGEWQHTWQYQCPQQVNSIDAQAMIDALEAVSQVNFFWLNDDGQGRQQIEDAGSIRW